MEENHRILVVKDNDQCELDLGHPIPMVQEKDLQTSAEWPISVVEEKNRRIPVVKEIDLYTEDVVGKYRNTRIVEEKNPSVPILEEKDLRKLVVREEKDSGTPIMVDIDLHTQVVDKYDRSSPVDKEKERSAPVVDETFRRTPLVDDEDFQRPFVQKQHSSIKHSSAKVTTAPCNIHGS